MDLACKIARSQLGKGCQPEAQAPPEQLGLPAAQPLNAAAYWRSTLRSASPTWEYWNL